jgi:hypothetical protein
MSTSFDWESKMTENNAMDRSKATLAAAKIGVIGTILAALLGAALPLMLRKYSGKERRKKRPAKSERGNQTVKSTFTFKLLEPADLEKITVGASQKLKGEYGSIPEKSFLWFAIRSDSAEKFALQGPIELYANGTWRHSLEIGDEASLAGQYIIRVLLVEEAVHEEMLRCQAPIKLATLGGQSKGGLRYVAEYHITR